MNITGMLNGARMLNLAGFPTPDILRTTASQCRFVVRTS